MWGKVLEAIGEEENLIYCCLEIPKEAYSFLPGVPGLGFLGSAERGSGRTPRESMCLMVERVVLSAIEKLRARLGREPELLFLPDGPYGVPEVRHAGDS
jgi:hypothetical protein